MSKSSAPILSRASARRHVLTCAVAAGLLSTCLGACGSSGSQKSSDGGAGGTTNVGVAGAGAGWHDGGSGGKSGADAGVDTGPVADRLALRCNADTDCGAGLICLKATDKAIAGGGPAHGTAALRAHRARSTRAPASAVSASTTSRSWEVRRRPIA